VTECEHIWFVGRDPAGVLVLSWCVLCTGQDTRDEARTDEHGCARFPITVTVNPMPRRAVRHG
jgi:hypothetical protein